MEKYLALARDSASAGDRVLAENYFQHADHYYRVLNARFEQQAPNGQQRGNGQGNQSYERMGGYNERPVDGDPTPQHNPGNYEPQQAYQQPQQQGKPTPGDPTAPSLVTPTEALAIAERYVSHSWRPFARNILHGPDKSGVLVNTPDVGLQTERPGWWIPGEANAGVPYKWGGFDWGGAPGVPRWWDGRGSDATAQFRPVPLPTPGLKAGMPE